MRRVLFLLAVILVAAAATVLACGTQAFDPQSKVDSVRMFAVHADKPFANPGDKVTLSVLMTDGRPAAQRTRPLVLYWIPLVCLNPTDDAYFECFVPGDGGALPLQAANPVDAGAGGSFSLGGDAGLPNPIDVTGALPQGPTFSFTMPEGAIISRKGSDPYGLAVVFNLACAGHVYYEPPDPSGGPQQVPLACTDENGVRLPPSDYVIGISRVYSYASRTNANPTIDKMTVNGVEIDASAGATIDRCVGQTKRENCPEVDLEVHVTDDSWELNPAEVTHGQQLHEQIWADYYSDIGDFDQEAVLLFDTQKGRIDDPKIKYRAPYDPTDGTVWTVVHDNRGGASWIVVPLHVR